MNVADIPSVSGDGEDAIQLVLETALDAVVIMNADGKIAEWSEQATKVFGWTSAEAIGAVLGTLIVPQRYRHAHEMGLRHYLRTGVGPVLRKRMELEALRRDGREFPIELSICPVRQENDIKFLAFVRDITERRDYEKFLRRQLQEATLLHRLASLAAGESTFEDVLRECLAAVCDIGGWPLAHAYIPRQTDALQLVPTKIWHPAGGEYLEFRTLTEASVFEAGVGLPGRVWNERGPVWIRSMKDRDRFPRSDCARAVGLNSGFAFPLFIHGEIAAILEFFSDAEEGPAEGSLLVFRTLAEQVGRVLERRSAEENMKKEIHRREKVEQHQDLLLAEMNHRVKNMLAVVVGMANQSGRASASIGEFTESFNARLLAMSRGYQLLTEKNWGPALIGDLVHSIVGPHVSDERSLVASGPPILLPPQAGSRLELDFA